MSRPAATTLGVLLATLWISLNEFLRNELFFKDHWTDHFTALGLDFPDATVNNMVWALWALAFAVLLRALACRFNLGQTAAAGWLAGFVLMWLTIGNLGVLPLDLLPVAVPWSLVETYGAAWIIHTLLRRAQG